MRQFQGKQVRTVLARKTAVVVPGVKPRRFVTTPAKLVDGKPAGLFVVYIKNQDMYLGDGTFTPTKWSAKRFDHRHEAQEMAQKLRPMGLDATVRGFANSY